MSKVITSSLDACRVVFEDHPETLLALAKRRKLPARVIRALETRIHQCQKNTTK